MGAASAGRAVSASLRPLLMITAAMGLAAVLYVLTLSLIVAAALSRLAVVHNSAAEYSERVYFGMPYVFSRRRGSVPGAAVPQRQARFHSAFPQTCQKHGEPRVQCAICIDTVRPGNLKRRLKCRHEFHKSCIDRWIDKGANRCPLCNKVCLKDVH